MRFYRANYQTHFAGRFPAERYARVRVVHRFLSVRHYSGSQRLPATGALANRGGRKIYAFLRRAWQNLPIRASRINGRKAADFRGRRHQRTANGDDTLTLLRFRWYSGQKCNLSTGGANAPNDGATFYLVGTKIRPVLSDACRTREPSAQRRFRHQQSNWLSGGAEIMTPADIDIFTG
jgi:hypothetical protein